MRFCEGELSAGGRGPRLAFSTPSDTMSDMAKAPPDARVIARLDEEERAILRRARAATGKTTSSVIKAALRVFARTLPGESALATFERHGVVGAISGPRDLSETYKQHVDYSDKHGGER